MVRKNVWLRRLAISIVILFVIANCVAFFHAWKFTHFDPNEEAKTAQPEKLSLSQKVGVLFTGVDLPRPKNRYKPVLPFEEVVLQSNRKINCWLIPRENPKGTVLVFHGYGGEMSSMLDKADIFHGLGYNVFMVDFMGSGLSEGNQTTIGFFESQQVKSAVDHIRNKGEKNIVVFGTSMGAAAVMRAVGELGVKAEKIILECPFGSMLQTVKNRFSNVGVPSFPLAHLLTFWGGVQNGFNAFSHNPEVYAKNIDAPVLMFYGQRDIKVSAEEIIRIHQNFRGLKKLVQFPNAAHENYLNKYKNEWVLEVGNFLQKSTPD